MDSHFLSIVDNMDLENPIPTGDKTKLAEESTRGIKTLIRSAEQSRKNNSKSTNYLNSYFKRARNLII